VAIWTVGDVIRRTQVLLDDPAGRRFKPDYIRPIIDQENEGLQIMLERLGVQQEEQIAIFNVPPATSAPTDLTAYFAPGQPLQYLMRPKRLDWKVVGQNDTSYVQADLVDELDDVLNGNVGCQQYRWAGGSIQTTPSYGAAVTLRIYFLALSQTIYDSSVQVMRGIGSILALQTADFIAAMNNDMGKLGPKLSKKLSIAKQNFTNLIVIQSQGQTLVPRGTKRGGAAQFSAGGVPYI